MNKTEIKQAMMDILDTACIPDGKDQSINTATIILCTARSTYTLRAHRDQAGKWVIGNE